MSSKTISVRIEAYEKLRAAKRYPGESFSQVILRASWPENTVSGAELLERMAEGPRLPKSALDAVDALKSDRSLPVDKWQRSSS